MPPITQASLDLEASRIRTAWDGSIIGALSHDVVWNEVFAEDLTPGSSMVSHVFPFFGHGATQTSLPGSCGFRLLPLGSTIPRPWQWSVRLFGIPEVKVVGNMISPFYADTLRQFIRDRYTLQGAFGWRPVVVQQVVGGASLSTGVSYDVTDYAVATYVVAPMRRRLH